MFDLNEVLGKEPAPLREDTFAALWSANHAAIVDSLRTVELPFVALHGTSQSNARSIVQSRSGRGLNVATLFSRVRAEAPLFALYQAVAYVDSYARKRSQTDHSGGAILLFDVTEGQRNFCTPWEPLKLDLSFIPSGVSPSFAQWHVDVQRREADPAQRRSSSAAPVVAPWRSTLFRTGEGFLQSYVATVPVQDAPLVALLAAQTDVGQMYWASYLNTQRTTMQLLNELGKKIK